MGLHPQPIFLLLAFFRYFQIFILVLGANNGKAQTMVISGSDWTVNIPPITEAGTNYAGTYESQTSQIQLTIGVPLLLQEQVRFLCVMSQTLHGTMHCL